MKEILVTKALLPSYEEYCEAIRPLWDTHWITNMGEYHKELEHKLKVSLGGENLSLFCNGHMAIELTLQAMELNGEVITTPFTFVSTTHAIVRNGLTPVFCDINPRTFTIDVNKIEELITDRTCAILPVHVYGNICEIEQIEQLAKKYNLKVIYDAAHAFGVSYKKKPIGEYGDASMFSFHATKVFNTIEGGAVTFTDTRLDEKLYWLKNFGIKSEDEVEYVGSNAKMNEFQAIMGLCNLRQIDWAIAERKRVYEIYLQCLSKIQGIRFCKFHEEQTQNYAYMPILIQDNFYCSRDELYLKLKENGIYARKYFYPLTNQIKCYEERFDPQMTPIAIDISNRVLTLPIEPTLNNEEVVRICSVLKNK